MCTWFDKVIDNKKYKIRPATDDGIDRELLKELGRLNDWYGLSTLLHIGWNTESFFHPDVGVVLDLDDIEKKTAAGGLNRDDAWTVISFILGHEQVHAFHKESGLENLDRKRREAHCDYLSGFYIGLLLTRGEIWPNSVRDVAFSIGSPNSPEYPTPDERRRCVVRGMSVMAWNMSAHFQIRKMGYSDPEFVEAIDQHIESESWNEIDLILSGKHAQ